MDAEQRVRELQLEPHPEGGFFRRIFQSALDVVPRDGRPSRPALTAVHFLLPRGSFSRWHRVLSDEAWTHLEGDPLLHWTFDAYSGQVTRRPLAPFPAGEPVLFVRAGLWQAAESLSGPTLVACFVGPGFDFADFQMAAGLPDVESKLRAAEPDAARLI